VQVIFAHAGGQYLTPLVVAPPLADPKAHTPIGKRLIGTAAFAMKFARSVRLHHIICCLKWSLVKIYIASVFWRRRICRDSLDKSISNNIIMALNPKTDTEMTYFQY
jgi:hypothetical protein